MEITFKYNIGDTVWGYNNKNQKIIELQVMGCSFGTPLRRTATGNYYDAIKAEESQAANEGRSVWHRSYMEYELFSTQGEAEIYAQNPITDPVINKAESGSTENIESGTTETEDGNVQSETILYTPESGSTEN